MEERAPSCSFVGDFDRRGLKAKVGEEVVVVCWGGGEGGL